MTRLVSFADGTTVPALGQGTWEIGDQPARRDAEQAALSRGIDLGLTLIEATVASKMPDTISAPPST